MFSQRSRLDGFSATTAATTSGATTWALIAMEPAQSAADQHDPVESTMGRPPGPGRR